MTCCTSLTAARLHPRAAAQDCCQYCKANTDCNAFTWCDAAQAKDGKCNPGGINDKSVPNDCYLYQSMKGVAC